MVDFLLWLLAVELLGLLALPLAFVLFRRLPDRGFSLAKPMALVLFSYALWVLGLILGAPLWIPWILLSPSRRRDFWERWKPLPRRRDASVWLHVASVGEAEAAAKNVALRKRRPRPHWPRSAQARHVRFKSRRRA